LSAFNAVVSQQGKMPLSTPAVENLSVLLFPISDLTQKENPVTGT